MTKILFLATEDWFVRSHFLPMVRRAVSDGHETLVAARMSDARQDLIDAGARPIDLADERGVYGIAALWNAVRRLRELIRTEQPDVLHAISLRPILLACLAAFGRSRPKLVLAVTGRGYLATEPTWRARRALDLLAHLIAWRVRAERAVLLVENDEDRAWVARAGALPAGLVVWAPGAGVELDRYAPTSEPAAPPIRIGMVSRLVRSKGADLAVEALRRLRGEGLDVTLSIAGASDFDNPAAVTAEEIATWAATPGVEIAGRVTDVSGFWADKHIACLPSRGGEGLPRSMLEAAACARPIVTSDAPGCADFAGVDAGIITPRGDVASLAAALAKLANDPALRRTMGGAGRARVAAGYTTAHAADAAALAWARAAPGFAGARLGDVVRQA